MPTINRARTTPGQKLYAEQHSPKPGYVFTNKEICIFELFSFILYY